MAKVTPETTMGEIIAMNEGTVDILLGAGMHCVGCPAHQFEAIAEAAMVHGIDANALIDELNAFLEANA